MLYVKAVVAAFNQEKALVGAFSVITNLRMELFEALVTGLHLVLHDVSHGQPPPCQQCTVYFVNLVQFVGDLLSSVQSIF